MKDNDLVDETTLSPEIKRAIKQMKETMPVATIYPWSDMDIGDSVLFHADKGESARVLRRRVGVSAYHYGKVSGKKFATKLLPEENAFRVWRTA
ncbi:MAG: hypothetical protein JRG75_09670 [Deltaproteobacteria bacterium]|nr:hypothetical protein [Deltaproteobacteria bacterium]